MWLKLLGSFDARDMYEWMDGWMDVIIIALVYGPTVKNIDT